MTIILTLAIYSLRISGDFPSQGEYIPIISIYFALELVLTFVSMIWFTCAECMRTKQHMPTFLAKLAQFLRALTSCRLKNKVVQKPKELDRKETIADLVAALNCMMVGICMVASFVSTLVIFNLLLTYYNLNSTK